MTRMQTQFMYRPVTDGFGGKLWWSVQFSGALTVSEAGFYKLPKIQVECQSDRPGRLVLTQASLEPAIFDEALPCV